MKRKFFKWGLKPFADRTKTATFCVLPWVHAATLTDGSVRLCCVAGGGSGINLNEQTLADYWNSEYVKDARRRMLAGEQVKACEHCYREEAHGYKSHRLVENEVWQKRCGADGIQDLAGKTQRRRGLEACSNISICGSATRAICMHYVPASRVEPLVAGGS